jgi:hypothetical protein
VFSARNTNYLQISHINSLKKKKHATIAIDAEKAHKIIHLDKK